MTPLWIIHCTLLFANVFLSQQTYFYTNIITFYSWIYPDYLYPNEDARIAALNLGRYIPENGLILDTDYYFCPSSLKRRVFVTSPQLRPGIPATISEVTSKKREDSFLLQPFPSWDAQNTDSCEGPTSVYRIHIDKCGLLWVLDSGITNKCRPKLLIYDLKNDDHLLRRYEFPPDSVKNGSNLVNLVIESSNFDCRDSIAYIADKGAYALVIYDYARSTSWRVESIIFHPNRDHGNFTINGVFFQLIDGVAGLALGPLEQKSRRLYFHSLASIRESYVDTKQLKNLTIIEKPNLLGKQIHTFKGVRDGQSLVQVMTTDGILIYSLLPYNALVCWNSQHPFEKSYQHIVYKNDETMQFISGMKLKENTLLVTTSRLQNYLTGNVAKDEVNYRVIVINDVKEFLRGTPCEKPKSHNRSYTHEFYKKK